MPSVKTSQSWTITDIQCHFFIHPTVSGSKIVTTTLLTSYDPYPGIFVPENIAEARKWTILRPGRVTVSSAIRRQKAATLDERSSAAPTCPPSLPACRDFSTWASDRDLWPWIQIFILLSSVILKVLRCRVQIFSWGDNKNALFSNQQKRWL